MFGRLKQMLIKEFLQMLRDPRMKAIVFVVPVVQMLIIAFALTTDVTRIATALLDDDHTPSSRALIEEFVGSGYFIITKSLRSEAEIQALLDRSEVRAVLRFPRGFENRLLGGRTAHIQLLTDGTENNGAAAISGYATQIIGRFSQRQQRDAMVRAMGTPPAIAQIEMETRAWFNPNLESKHYYVPGLIAIMLMVISLLLTSIAIVREKEIGTIEQLMVTPISKIEFILGKTIPYLIIGYINMTLMFIVAKLIFGIHVQGSWLLLYAMAGVYVAGNLGLALAISVSAATQQQALLTAFFFLMPGILLSGFLFPLDNMPPLALAISAVDPMRWFIQILRGVTLRGVGIETLWRPMLAQGALAVAFLTFAALRFRKTIS
ncbi:MAG: ABC transporter permease [Candidatus Sumerlaeota bacterium]|nr:ABC transporter permease [Candidatus Sumerlaeota bacterium]